ncbi:sugar phosphate isomerase/epimerase family protein [Gordoniibacillus kamchatkensis]|uniref:sugar phosphate isomerase/epimerase family protein n=1 Tax=Gordoniibacillus kamchatkensis TaxID=1590651 RepID=UPI0006971382|nr:sugar phosphate isomerase/epimerase family protein [Paenibacillus sp. VKM B-2647]
MFPFKLSLNTSTLIPYKLGIEEQIRVAAEAGYEGIEIWVRDLEAYAAGGGKIGGLRSSAESCGIQIVNAIAFWAWSDEDAAERARGFELARRELELLAELGCPAAAAPPFGRVENVPLEQMAGHFAELAELARGFGVEPLLEFWGRAGRLSRLGEAVYVAIESGVADAKLLLDPFHMYTGGSSIEALSYVNGERIGIVHVNDYPASPPRETIADRDRVFPGEGIFPSGRFAKLLHEAGYSGYLSLELFIQDFHGSSALDVARRGIESVRSAYTVT